VKGGWNGGFASKPAPTGRGTAGSASIGERRLAIGNHNQRSAISNQQSAISNQQSAISNQQLPVGGQESISNMSRIHVNPEVI
jgi:hypothetical protein